MVFRRLATSAGALGLSSVALHHLSQRPSFARSFDGPRVVVADSRVPAASSSPAVVRVRVDEEEVAARQLSAVTRLGLGGALGAACGYMAQKSLRFLAIVVGLEFAFLQWADYTHLITINWRLISSSSASFFSRDGQQRFWSGILRFLTRDLPFKSAFIGAFVLGFRVR
uniref:FUN14 domain-containing protein n=1 Tax=Sexangularia sp. CB-2014 TaxID=1486929 RepID=A0A7S1YDV1_9EUKA